MTTSWDAHRFEVPTLLDAIGRTPLVRLQRVPPGVDLLAKVEWYGPTGSVKDRIYAAMLTKAEERGDLAPDDDHRMHHRQRRHRLQGRGGDQGLPVRIVMPEGMSSERKR